MTHHMYRELAEIDRRPALFAEYTATELWTDDHIAQQMLRAHLDSTNDRASYRVSLIDAAVGWIVDQFGVRTGTGIADFGCGPGLYATRLASHGAHVTAIDFSLNSLRYAEAQATLGGISIDFVHGNYLSFVSERRFDLILLISCDFGALSPTQRNRLLTIFSDHLAEGGAILLDVQTLAAFAEQKESSQWAHRLGNGFWAAEDYYGFLRSFCYPVERVALDKYSIVTTSGVFTMYNWDQFFDKSMLADEFDACGLVIDEWYSNVAGEPYTDDSRTMAVVARKASA